MAKGARHGLGAGFAYDALVRAFRTVMLFVALAGASCKSSTPPAEDAPPGVGAAGVFLGMKRDEVVAACKKATAEKARGEKVHGELKTDSFDMIECSMQPVKAPFDALPMVFFANGVVSKIIFPLPIDQADLKTSCEQARQMLRHWYGQPRTTPANARAGTDGCTVEDVWFAEPKTGSALDIELMCDWCPDRKPGPALYTSNRLAFRAADPSSPEWRLKKARYR